MTFYLEPSTAKMTQHKEFKGFWFVFAERINRVVHARRKNKKARSASALPKSGMPISNDAATQSSIRSGTTAGPW